MFDLMKTERKGEDPEEELHSTIYRKSCLLMAVVLGALMMCLLYVSVHHHYRWIDPWHTFY